ncbi:MAG: cob(I)yrinic acid a,c-diamide adenosyltransferase [Lachnospiraceae bacterium]|nr:cob(I)yrinic acid a,c-diamide adenosyltransferase [Lachnospiraceae bacterium]
MDKGLIHLYHGDGKGKTTAAIGLAMRVAGYGKRVLFAQFLKDDQSGEVAVLKEMPLVLYFSDCDMPKGFYHNMNEEQKQALCISQRKLFENMRQSLFSISPEEVGLLVLDELTYVYSWGILDKEDVLSFLKNKPETLEIVITGRNPGRELLDLADYVTEMKMKKHPFSKGIPARKGIEY